MVLDLVLTYYWYDEILSGRKTNEYREIKDIWIKRIWNNRDKITHVRFHRGYTMTTITVRVDRIHKTSCPYEGWDDKYFNIYLNQDDVYALETKEII